MDRLICRVMVAALVVAAASRARAADVREALAAQRDIWGEAAMARAEGPTYEYFEGLLPPLRYVDTPFGCYPIALAGPLANVKARWVSNGSGVGLPAGDVRRWHDYPAAVRFRMGDEAFGADLARVDGPTYERGWVPVVRVGYRVGKGVVDQEAFVPAEGEMAENGVVMVRFTGRGGEARVTAAIDGDVTGRDGSWVDKDGKALVRAGVGWGVKGKELVGTVAEGRPLVLAVGSVAGEIGPVSEQEYGRLRARCVEVWEGYLGRCARVEVPEERVNRAWRALVAGSLMAATGDRMCYSAGNVYERLYEAESGDAMRGLMVFGLGEEARRMTGPLLRYEQKGLGFHDAAFKLQMLAQEYWLTRDKELIRATRELWGPAVRLIVESREKASGLLPKENYCADIATQVYSLNSNANSWRGLRDMAAVLADVGEAEEAGRLAATAGEFRGRIMAAVEKSERRDVSPTFIPVALFGAEQPYERLTDSRLGSYWDLMIPYVLGSQVLDEGRERAAIEYLQTHGGVCMGMIRFHQHSGLFANEDGVDDLYGLRYVQALLRRDEADRAVVSFYGKLAQGLTRETFTGGEGTGLVPIDQFGRGMYLPPNTAGNGFFLTMLREMLVQDQDEDGDGRPETLRLLFATPRGWMEDGKEIKAEGMPTAFGAVSVVARSELSKGRVVAEVTLPERCDARRVMVRARVPAGWRVTGAEIGGKRVEVDGRGTAEVPAGTGRAFRVVFSLVGMAK